MGLLDKEVILEEVVSEVVSGAMEGLEEVEEVEVGANSYEHNLSYRCISFLRNCCGFF